MARCSSEIDLEVARRAAIRGYRDRAETTRAAEAIERALELEPGVVTRSQSTRPDTRMRD